MIDAGIPEREALGVLAGVFTAGPAHKQIQRAFERVERGATALAALAVEGFRG
jgi:hypothetical protein